MKNLLIIKPKLSMACVLLSIYFLLMPFDLFKIGNTGTLLKGFSILPIAACLCNRKNLIFVKHRLSISVVILLLYWSLGIIYSVCFEKTISQYLTQMLNMGMILITGYMNDYEEEEISFLTNCLVLSALLCIVLTFVYSDYSDGGRLTIKIGESNGDQNYLNGYLLFAVAYCMQKLFLKKRMVFCFPLIGIIVFSLMTGSRGGLLSIFAVMFVAAMYCINNSKWKIITILLLAVSIIVVITNWNVLLMLLPSSVANRFTLEYISERGTTGRTQIWLSLLQTMRNAPVFRQLFGYGLMGTTVVNPVQAYGQGFVAHNLWIEQLVDGGIIGLILLVYMQVVFFYEAIKQKNIIFISAYFGYLTMCLSMSLLSYKPMWNCMIMIMIIQRHNKKKCI